VPVGGHVEIKRGVSWGKEQEFLDHREGTVPVIRISNVQESLELDNLLYISGLKKNAIDEKRVSKDWSLIVGSNGNRNRVGNAVLIKEDTDYLFASFLVAAKPVDGTSINPNYFFRWLSSEPVQAKLSATAEGTTGLNNLSHNFFKRIEIPTPSPEEQKAIAHILDAVDDTIEKTRETLKLSFQLRKALVSDLLSKGINTKGLVRNIHDASDSFNNTPIGKLPSEWTISTIEKQFDLQTGFTLNENRRPRYNKRPYLRVANVQRDELKLDDILELDATDNEYLPRKLELNDLLVVEGHANRMQIGRCAKVSDEAVGLTFQNHLFRLRCSADIIPYFGCLWLNSTYAQKYWNARCATSSGLNTINQRMLKRLIVPVPSKREQEAISEIIASQRDHYEQLKLKLKNLLHLKISLMQDLLTGNVRVNQKAKGKQ
jgi:type I restriction enzyme S subunit